MVKLIREIIQSYLRERWDTLSISESDDENELKRDIIMWMDHRAIDQANKINETHNKVLNNVGGKISPETELPKLLWLKENKPSIYQKASQ